MRKVDIQAEACVKVAELSSRWANMSIELLEVIVLQRFPSNRSVHNIESVPGQYVATNTARKQNKTLEC